MINKNGKMTIAKLGNDKTPLIIIDDFLSDPEVLIDAAVRGPGFKDVRISYYPGKKGLMLESHIQAIVQNVLPMYIKHYNVPDNMTLQLGSCFYGLATQHPDELNPQQCYPHIDCAGDFYFVAIIYLNEGDFGGTSFYRHVPTGVERVLPDEVDACFEGTDKVKGEAGYYAGDGDYKIIGTADYKRNRLALYPSNLIHGPAIKNPSLLSDDPRKGRLTANIISRFVPAP